MKPRHLPVVALAAALALHATPSGAIVGGSAVPEGEMPWAAAIYNTESPSSGQFCGGSLVAPRLVVTAAHCITQFFDDALAQLPVDLLGWKIKVMLGRTELSGSGGEQIVAERLFIHPDAPTNDVAVLRLERASGVAPIAFARSGQAAFFAPGVVATIAGWGNTSEGGASSDRLLKASVPIVADGQCAGPYGSDYDGSAMLCAGYADGGVDACQGDSGGPLVVPGPGGAPLLAGATSFGIGCARSGYPGVYAEIAAVADFIVFHAG